MADNAMLPLAGYPLSELELRKYMGNGPRFEFLRFFARDRIHIFDDFTQPVIATDNWTYTAPGATATGFVHSPHQSGIIRGVSGTTAATSGLKITTPAMWYGDQFAGMEMRLRTSVITETRIEAGFAATSPTINTKYINSLATPTFNTTANGALYVYDNASATTTTGLYTIGTAITAAKTATTAQRFVADTFLTVRIQLVIDQVYCWVNGQLMVKHNVGTTQYIEGGTANSLVLSIVRSDTTTANNDVDYIRVWQARL